MVIRKLLFIGVQFVGQSSFQIYTKFRDSISSNKKRLYKTWLLTHQVIVIGSQHVHQSGSAIYLFTLLKLDMQEDVYASISIFLLLLHQQYSIDATVIFGIVRDLGIFSPDNFATLCD